MDISPLRPTPGDSRVWVLALALDLLDNCMG